jgi:GcrA cell cycle regulator
MTRPKAQIPASINNLRRARSWPDGVPVPPAGAYRGNSRWSYEEEQQLRACYRKYGIQYAARLLGRSVDAISARASILGLTQPAAHAGKPRPWARKGWSPPPWRKRDDEQLHRLHAQGLSTGQIAETMGRTRIDVRTRARSIGVYRHQRSWSLEEDQLLRTLYGTVPYQELASRLGRSVTAVIGHASYRGIAQPRTGRPWNATDDKRLRSLYGRMPNAEAARRMDRSEDAVILRAGKLGLTRETTPPWSAREDATLKRLHAAGMSYKAIAHELSRTRNAVAGRVMKLGLAATQPMRAPRWTNQEMKTLRKLYGTVRNREIGSRLGRSSASVEQKARELGIAGEPSRSWTAQEDRYIKRHYGRMPREEIAAMLGRTVPAIAGRAGFLGVTRKRRMRN